jgi:amino acid permease
MHISSLFALLWVCVVALTEARVPGIGMESAVSRKRMPYQDPKKVEVQAASGALLPEGTSDVSSSIFNLAKVILGAGVLSLPSGIAAFSDSTDALLPATVLLAAMGIVSAYSFSSIGKACKMHDVGSFTSAWASSVGEGSAPFIATMITVKTFFACLAFSIILGDSFSSIARSVGLPEFMHNRSNMILLLTTCVITPLNMLKNMDLLKYTSMLGLGGILYCAAFIVKRYFDGSYTQGGKFFQDIAVNHRPAFNTIMPGDKSFFAVFTLVAMIATAFVAHYSASRFWVDLKQRTIPKYNKVVAVAFSFSALMYGIIMYAGFLTFGGNSLGFILNNYSSNDVLATIARAAIGFGILFGYPLTFVALRDGALDLLKLNSSASTPLTIALMAMLTVGALNLTNLGKVVAFSGSLIGSNLIYTVPAIMNLKNIYREARSKKDGKAVLNRAQAIDRNINVGLMAMGVGISIIGVYVTLSK